jgi:pimeloyl-ACP methyl ester carboxylesterase
MRRVAKVILTIVIAVSLLLVATLISFRVAAALRESHSRADAAPKSGRFVRAGDVELYIQQAGPADGPVVLLVHGTGAWGAIWAETMRALADSGFRSIAVDMPPFGFSERPATPTYDEVTQGNRIVALLDALNVSQVTLVGHSFGARATMAACFSLGARVRSLVLVDAALGVDSVKPPTTQLPFPVGAILAVAPLRDAIISATVTNPMLSRRLLTMLIRDPADARDATVRTLQQPFAVSGATRALGEWLRPFILADNNGPSGNRALYQALRIPVLLVWGDADTITPLAQGENLARLIPGARLVVLHETGHIPAIEDAAGLNREIVGFLAKARHPE